MEASDGQCGSEKRDRSALQADAEIEQRVQQENGGQKVICGDREEKLRPTPASGGSGQDQAGEKEQVGKIDTADPFPIKMEKILLHVGKAISRDKEKQQISEIAAKAEEGDLRRIKISKVAVCNKQRSQAAQPDDGVVFFGSWNDVLQSAEWGAWRDENKAPCGAAETIMAFRREKVNEAEE